MKIAGAFAADHQAITWARREVVDSNPPGVSIDLGGPSNSGLVQIVQKARPESYRRVQPLRSFQVV